MHEVDLLATRWRQQQWREDRRAAMPAWLLANVNRDSETRREPFSLEEVVAWLGHGFAPPEAPPPPAEPPTGEDLLGRVHLLHQLYTNGQQPEDQ